MVTAMAAHYLAEYNGMRKDNTASAILGAEFSCCDEETGSWIDFLGTDLLSDSRDMSLVWKDAGNWKLIAEYGELTHQNPNQINTGAVGYDTTRPKITALPAGAERTNFDLQTKRTKLGVAFAKIITPRLQLDVDLKSENKRGSLMFGIGMNCPTFTTRAAWVQRATRLAVRHCCYPNSLIPTTARLRHA